MGNISEKERYNQKEELNIYSKTKTVVKRIVILIAALAIISVFLYYENNHLETTGYEYDSDKVPKEFNGLRIVQISDLHNATFGDNNLELYQQVAKIKPDIVLITGDIVDSNHTHIPVAVDFVKNMADFFPCPTYFVTGNHECWLETEEKLELYNGMEEAGVTVLSNEAVIISRENGEWVCFEDDEKVTKDNSIRIVGLDDSSISTQALPTLMEENEKKLFTILLSHEPTYFEWYVKNGPDMVFTGHEHGGQFRLPLVGAVIAPDQGLFPELTEGVHTEGNTTMYISRGLGNSVIPFRLFNDPEIVYVVINQ